MFGRRVIAGGLGNSVIRFVVLVFAFAGPGCATKKVASPAVDRGVIRKVVYSHIREVQKCYMDTIDLRPGAEGKLVAGWVILPDGKSSEVEIKSSDRRLSGIDNCMLAEISSWIFPKPAGNQSVEVTYPFYFSENGRFGESDD